MARSRIAQLSSMTVFVACAFALLHEPALADVTVQEQTTFDLSLIKAHGTSTELTSGDKQRRDADMHCDGMMSFFCRNMGSGEVTRLDKDLIWTLNPKDKSYTETHFPTAAERQAAEEKMRAVLEKLKQCPARPGSNEPDTSKCQMSPPKIDAHQTDQHMTIAGHDARLSQISLTESCHTPDNSDTCDFIIAMDSWLTQDEIPGDRRPQGLCRSAPEEAGTERSRTGPPRRCCNSSWLPTRMRSRMSRRRPRTSRAIPLKTSNPHPLRRRAVCRRQEGRCLRRRRAAPWLMRVPLRGRRRPVSTAGEAQSAAGQAASNAAGNGTAGRIFGSAAGAFTNKLASGLFAKKPASTPAAAATPAADIPAEHGPVRGRSRLRPPQSARRRLRPNSSRYRRAGSSSRLRRGRRQRSSAARPPSAAVTLGIPGGPAPAAAAAGRYARLRLPRVRPERPRPRPGSRRSGVPTGARTALAPRAGASCVPCSTIAPWSRTMSRSMAAMVDRRWAIATTVLPRISPGRVSWMAASTSESSALVASSSSRIGASLSITRASATRCRCPPESFTPRSPTMAS